MNLVPRDASVDLARPLIDAAGHGLNVVVALATKPCRYRQRPRAVVADHDNMRIGVQLVIGPSGYVIHRNVFTSGDIRGFNLPRLTHVQ